MERPFLLCYWFKENVFKIVGSTLAVYFKKTLIKKIADSAEQNSMNY